MYEKWILYRPTSASLNWSRQANPRNLSTCCFSFAPDVMYISERQRKREGGGSSLRIYISQFVRGENLSFNYFIPPYQLLLGTSAGTVTPLPTNSRNKMPARRKTRFPIIRILAIGEPRNCWDLNDNLFRGGRVTVMTQPRPICF